MALRCSSRETATVFLLSAVRARPWRPMVHQRALPFLQMCRRMRLPEDHRPVPLLRLCVIHVYATPHFVCVFVQIAEQFSHQYYTVFSNYPRYLHRFYDQVSVQNIVEVAENGAVHEETATNPKVKRVAAEERTDAYPLYSGHS